MTGLALDIQASGETIYMWGGIFNDETLEAPVPLKGKVLRPGDPLDMVTIRCLIPDGVGEVRLEFGRRERELGRERIRVG